MPKVKLVSYTNGYYDGGNIDDDIINLDWEEISDEDYATLTSWAGQRYLSLNNMYLALLKEETKNCNLHIKNIKDLISKENAAKQAEKDKKIRAKEKAKLRKIEQAKKILKESGEL